MTAELDNTSKNQDIEIVNKIAKKPLMLFKTEINRYGRDIAVMSDFFDGYVQQMSLALRTQSSLESVSELPVADLGIINDVIHQADVVMRGDITLLPDFDNLPADIKTKMKKGIYKLGNSKQVDGNLRAVILDENDVRVRDITLKRMNKKERFLIFFHLFLLEWKIKGVIMLF